MNVFKRIYILLFRGKGALDKALVNERAVAEQKVKEILQLLEPHKRTCYVPQTVEIEPRFSAQHKMGGYPYLRDKNDWPTCPECVKHMQLFVQLNMEELPEQQGEGLVQLFYCTTSQKQKCYDEVVCRRIKVDGPSAEIKPAIEELFAEVLIVSWIAINQYSGWPEYEELGIEAAINQVYDGTVDNEVELLMENHEVAETMGDKLFGWPRWQQDQDYPIDKQTGQRMDKLLFEIISDYYLPFNYADSGTGHLFQSTENPDKLELVWSYS